MKRQLTGKVPDAGKDRGPKEKRMSEDEMAGLNHRCNEHELRQTLGDGEGQEGLACCSPWGCKESATTGWLKNNSNKMWNLEKLYRQTHLKSRSRDAHIVNRHVGMRWGVE